MSEGANTRFEYKIRPYDRVDTRGNDPSEHGEREGEARLPQPDQKPGDGQAPSGFAGGGGDASPYK